MLWLLALPLLVIPLIQMTPPLKNALGALYDRLGTILTFLREGELLDNPKHPFLRHSRPFVIYQGTKTTVTTTVFSKEKLPKDARVWLQRRGWRCGIFGWTVGGYLGGSLNLGLEVTPATTASSTTLDRSQTKSLTSDIIRLVPSSITETYPHHHTLIVHIPVQSGDGYFRIVVTTESKKQLAHSPVFRVGSLTLASAHPRGATLLGLVPELVLRSLSVAAHTAAFAAFYTAFPFLKLASWMPGPWKQWALNVLYSRTGGEERWALRDRIDKANVRWKQANDKMYKTVPFGAIGVRTAADLIKDEELGRQGTRIIDWYTPNLTK